MSPSLRAFLKTAARLVAALILVFFAYGAFVWWDMHEVESFCKEIKVGAPLSILAQLADRYRIDKKVVSDGIFDEKTKSWVLYVPAGTTMGEFGCSIHHNNSVVVSAETYGP